jgi:asparagine synthase (glutamine-hydrolysing)
MCGIFGVFSREPDLAKARLAIAAIQHRGPDYLDCVPVSDHLVFAHARLSILDLSQASNQPFHMDEGNLSITYNGEIYNFIELRNELIGLGASFETDGDTEVLLKAYQYFGADCVHKLNGMWSFAIYDRRKELVFCSRDRFGVKPFLFHHANGSFIFASEAKAILKYQPELAKPNYTAIANYVRNSYGAQGIETWFLGIQRLLAGHSAILDASGHLKIWRYYHYPAGEQKIPYSEACAQYRNLFFDAVKLRMRSDVPVGITLSSGVDSASIATAIRTLHQGKLNSYTVYFPENKAQKEVFKGLETITEEKTVRHLEKDLDLSAHYELDEYRDYLPRLQRIIAGLESGHASSSIVPLERVYARAKQDVTVVLEGQGADELLGGYIVSVIFDAVLSNLLAGKWKQAYQNLRKFGRSYHWKHALSLFVRQNTPNSLLRFVFKLVGHERIFGPKLAQKPLLSESASQPPVGSSLLKKKLFRFHSGGLADLLHYGDILSMQHGLEARNPFMDYRLVEFAFQMPDHYLVKNGEGKMLHKDALRADLPPYILQNVHKIPFSNPFYTLLAEKSESGVIEYIRTRASSTLFSKPEIEKLISEQQKGVKDHSRKLFRVLCTLIWFEVFEIKCD